MSNRVALKEVTISLDASLLNDLSEIAKEHHKSIESVMKSLIFEALEYKEDQYFCKLMEEFENKSDEWMTYEELWDKVQTR